MSSQTQCLKKELTMSDGEEERITRSGSVDDVGETQGDPDNFRELLRQETLLKTGALQDAIFNSANFSSIATDAKGVIQIFNVGAERMLGYTAAEVVNTITPADISEPQELIARAEALSDELETPITPGFDALVFKASRGIEDIYELTYIRKDGSRFPAVVSVTALRDAQESIIGYLLIGTDNTASKLAEEALLKAGALQSAIFNSANFSSIATDAHGVIQIFNVGAERMLGYTADEVVNTITPADISDPQEVISRAKALSAELGTPIAPGFDALVFKASRGIEDIYELTYIRKDGSRFPAVVSVTALRDAQETIIGYLLIGTDNTARKEIEAEQMKLDQRFRDHQFYTRSLIESNIDAIMATDPSGIITDVNKQMEALTGCTRDELIGAPFKNFFTDPERAEASIKQVLREKSVTDYELTARARDGKETVVSYNATTFYDRNRILQGVFAAARDVTERKRFERALQEKNVELENATRMKSEFLATMSHELRTPLNAIIGFSEVIKDGLVGSLSDVQREYIGDIFTSGQHLLSLINDILDLSKVEAGMMTLELEPVDLESLLSNSLSIIKEKAAAHSIHLELENGRDLGDPHLDVRKTKQIIYNLLANAVKFTPDGGHVTISARRVPRSSVGLLPGTWQVYSFPLADSEYNEFIELCISDSGIGISKENMQKLFLPFTQIDSRLARKFEGTGLGLSLVRQMVELHGGTVAVASAEGEGSSFAAWLPLRGPGEAAVPLPQSDSAPAVVAAEPSGHMALVVEDDDHAAELIRLLLEAEGFTVLRAATAEDGLLLAAKHPLRLITLDLILPGMDGWDFLERIRESSTLAQVPVVIMSILGDSSRNFGLSSGAAAVLQKPINRDQLHDALKRLGQYPAPGEKRTVLVVDDDPNAVELIATFLPAPEYEVVRAYGGSEAIDLAQQIRPDLIVLDLMMPQVSGFDVVDALRNDTDTAHIPIMVVTAKDVTAQDRAALSGNPDQVIHIVEKTGVDRFHFIAEVRRVLSLKSPPESPQH
jgi:PAS domain S-box-containing protein